MWAMGLYAVALVALYTLYALAFAYTVEDQYIERELRERAAVLRADYDRDGRWPALTDPQLRLLHSPEEFPDALRQAYAAEPQRREFAGAAGRHYHLLDFEHAGARWWLLAEVGDRLVFRRMRPVVIEILAWSALGALGFGLLLAAWVARVTSRRLVALSDEVRALDPDRLPRALPDPPELRGDAELIVLRQGLNELLARIADSIEREQSFTRDASHELRTPLAVVVASAEQLQRSQLRGTDAQALAQLQMATAQLGQTLDALLELARAPPATASAGGLLLPAIERTIVEQAARRPRTDLEFVIDVDPGLCVALRPALLRIVLANLIGNVFAHAAPGTVDIAAAGARCRIVNQAASGLGQTQRSAGLGLGLSILRRLDERYGLDLRIEARAERVYASFALTPATQLMKRGAVAAAAP